MPNPYYAHGTFPVTGSSGSSAAMRAELDSITAGFDLLPTLSGNAGKYVLVNSSATAMTVSSVLSESGSNLGIGTSSPATKLDVRGSSVGGNFSAISVDNTAGGAGVNTVSLNFANAGAVKNSITGAVFGNGYLAFATNDNTERMRLDASGNLGLGVTPSAWGGGFKALEMSNGSVSISANGPYINQNAIYDTAWKYKANGLAAQYFQNAGVHFWYTAPSGTAGNAISFTQAMTLDASGQLSVGLTLAENSVGVYALPTGELRVKDNTEDGTSQISIYNINTTSDSEQFFVAMNGESVDLGNRRSGSGGLKLFTANTERARITSGGDLLVGTTSNANNYKTFIQGTGSGAVLGLFAANATTPYGINVYYSAAAPNNGNANTSYLYCNDTSTVRIQLSSNGGIQNYQANDTNLSDRREKTNFTPAKSYLDAICAIPVQTFNYIDQNLEEDPGLTLGVVAQDVKAVAPELVKESNWGTEDEPKMRLSVYQTDLQYALMKCIQEQQALITDLRARVAALEQA